MKDQKLTTYLASGVEVPAGTPGAVKVETRPIGPEEGMFQGGMTKGRPPYRSALFIDDGHLDPDRSVADAYVGGNTDGTGAEGGTITSREKCFNGIMVNDSRYRIKNLTMTAEGCGGNDFKGYGAGIAAFGKSNVDVDRFVFSGQGAIRHGVFAGGTSPEDGLAVRVSNSYIRADGSKGRIETDGMSACPWMLGISPEGHARATMCAGHCTVQYDHDILLSDGWGVLSVDDTGDGVEFGNYAVEMQVRDSVIDVTTDGTDDPSCYGTYSVLASRNRFYHCTAGDAADSDAFRQLREALPDTGVHYDYQTKKYGMTYGAVVANTCASVGWYDGCQVTAKYGMMYHKTNHVRFVPGKTAHPALPDYGVTQVEDSTFLTQGAAFLVKGCTPVIEVKNSKFIAENGVLVQAMTCDDPGMMTPVFSEQLDIAAPVPKDPGYHPYDYNCKDMEIARTQVKDMISDVQVFFSDCNRENGTALCGSCYNSISVATTGEGMTWWGQNLILNLDHCDLTGACSSAAAIHEQYSYYMADADNYYGGIPINADGYEIAGTWTKAFNIFEKHDNLPKVEPTDGTSSEPLYFLPDFDENGNLIVIGENKLTPSRGCIVSQNATYLGALVNTPAPTVNNGVWVALKNRSTWTPTGINYLSRLEVSADSRILGSVTVDGTPVTPEADHVYTGEIIVRELAL